ncbi:hypothetical protein ES703_86653 [subsurface metagenome]
MKVFECPKCKCRRFWRRITREQIVDWTREGAVEGHPYLEGGPLPLFPIVFVCAECGEQVDEKTAAKMEDEVL